jgi:hypothetical protein
MYRKLVLLPLPKARVAYLISVLHGRMDNQFRVLPHPFEKTENPQSYSHDRFLYVHRAPARHTLGLVGGNEVTLPKGNMVDVESDLLGLNIPLTKCSAREYQPPPPKQTYIQRRSTKGEVTIDVRPRHLPAIQMWPYSATFAPIPMNITQCGSPEKY